MKHLRFTNLRRSLGRWICAGIFFLPVLAQAHPGHVHPGEDDEFDAFASGLIHPFSGIDHLLLALAVGWYAFSLRKGGKLTALGSFLGALAIGASAGRGSQAGTGLLLAIALTLVGAGALVLWKTLQKPSIIVASASVAGLVHGFSHGSTAPMSMGFVTYIIGFVVGSAVLVSLGGTLQKMNANHARPIALAGGFLIATGSILFFQAI